MCLNDPVDDGQSSCLLLDPERNVEVFDVACLIKNHCFGTCVFGSTVMHCGGNCWDLMAIKTKYQTKIILYSFLIINF